MEPSMQAPWPAPVAATPVRATVAVPGSKSMTNRALVLAALAQTPTTIRAPLRSRDTTLMVAGLRAMGTTVEDSGADWRVSPAPFVGPAVIDVGLAGTVMRFLPPIATLATGDVSFDGDEGARRRPLQPVLDGLTALGADITSSDGRLPLTVHGRGWLLGGSVTVDASQSSMFVSALLLAAPRFANGVEVVHEGPRVPSMLHIAMTVAMLRQAGAIVEDIDPNTWRVEPGPLRLDEFRVEPDLSNAAPFLAAAAVTGGSVHVPGWLRATTQPGEHFLALLAKMGAEVERTDDSVTVHGTGRLRGIDTNFGDAGEFVTTAVALAALADSPTRLRGIAHLRGHETDRLKALTAEINRLGGDAEETTDGLIVRPRELHAGTVQTYADHRMATFAAVLGLRVPDISIVDIATTAKTMPGFVDLWTGMLS
jgi:3-phosphoshikimate 1-carboxyvinyltransferase